MQTEKLRAGIGNMVLASFFFACMAAFTRILKDSLHTSELVFFRNLIGVLFLTFSVWKRPLHQKGGKPYLLVFRGIIGTLALYMLFYSIQKLGLPVAITYQQTYPIFIAILSYFWLGETLNLTEWIAISLGFSGICFIFLPQIQIGDLSLRNHIIGLGNALLTGLAYLSIRELSGYYDKRSIVLSFMLSGILLPIISFWLGKWVDIPSLDFLFGKFILPKGMQWLWLSSIGITALLGQIFLTNAFTYGRAAPIAAAGYSNIVFSMLFGWLLGDSMPSFLGYLGISLVIFSGILLSYKSKEKVT